MKTTKKFLNALTTLTMGFVRLEKEDKSMDDIINIVSTGTFETHRPIKIYCRVILGYGAVIPNGSIPIFSVDSEEEAYRLLMLTCPTGFSHERVATELIQENLGVVEQRLKQGHVMLHGKGRS